ncbi:MAG: hypothetical protein A3F16_07340 [Deltaproteobacteria bacterium RIFCSPHIGHO2_12_FULL_43_9]|nr:MAG: hypothetical protein A3F16_07340 [Deltaproteobacteria bacterium RIFCSPHIGHO2_12_FULL_43_9]
MFNQPVKEKIYLVAILDSTLLVISFLSAFLIRGYLLINYIPTPYGVDLVYHIWLLIFAIPLFWVVGNQAGLYQIYSPRTVYGILWRTFRTVATLGLILGSLIFLLKAKEVSRLLFFLFCIVSFIFISLARIALKTFLEYKIRQKHFLKRVLIVGTNPGAIALRKIIESHPQEGLNVIGHLSGPGEPLKSENEEWILGNLSDLKTLLEKEVVDEVFFAISMDKLMICDTEIAWCEEIGITVHLKLDFQKSRIARSYATELGGEPLLTLSPTPRNAIDLLVKRTIDLSASSASLIMLFPLFLLVGSAIKLTSPGPLFFRQERIGLNGRTFWLYKFRSMVQDAEAKKKDLRHLNEVSGPVFKIKNDPRVTTVGKYLRKLSIDELPQLWNVFRGDMSLVGPRPPLPDEVNQYQRWQRRRLSMKPGITCLWQIKGRNKIGFDDWMRYDLQYIDNWSLTLDLKILLKTIPAVFSSRGAY